MSLVSCVSQGICVRVSISLSQPVAVPIPGLSSARDARVHFKLDQSAIPTPAPLFLITSVLIFCNQFDTFRGPCTEGHLPTLFGAFDAYLKILVASVTNSAMFTRTSGIQSASDKYTCNIRSTTPRPTRWTKITADTSKHTGCESHNCPEISSQD